MMEGPFRKGMTKKRSNVLAKYGVTIFAQSAVKNAMLAYSIMNADAVWFKHNDDIVKENWEHSTAL
jgi:hypothetical protein